MSSQISTDNVKTIAKYALLVLGLILAGFFIYSERVILAIGSGSILLLLIAYFIYEHEVQIRHAKIAAHALTPTGQIATAVSQATADATAHTTAAVSAAVNTAVSAATNAIKEAITPP